MTNTPAKTLTEGTKYDEGKLRLDLIPPEAIKGLADVLGFGARKYADRNWERGIKYSRVLGALKRHILAFELGVRYDEETGFSHLDHALCCAAFLSTYEHRGMGGFNDLPHVNGDVLFNVLAATDPYTVDQEPQPDVSEAFAIMHDRLEEGNTECFTVDGQGYILDDESEFAARVEELSDDATEVPTRDDWTKNNWYAKANPTHPIASVGDVIS